METEKQELSELIPYAAQQYNNIKLLPNLNKNIQCGNSLIGTDYYTNADMALINQQEIQKINAFDWEKSFPEIFDNSGFDCVIGPTTFNYNIWKNLLKPLIKNQILKHLKKQVIVIVYFIKKE